MAEEKKTVEATATETKKPAAKKTTTKKTTTSTTAKTTAPKKATTTKKAATTKKVEEKPAEAKVEETAEVKEAPKAAKKPAAKKTTAKKPAAKKETKVEEVKPLRTEAFARAVSLKVTPRKARLVCDLVRGKNVADALNILANCSHKAAPLIAKLIKSAYANAVNNFNLNGDKLYISNIQASDSIKMRRFLPRAKGSASGLVKRFSNVIVTVKERM